MVVHGLTYGSAGGGSLGLGGAAGADRFTVYTGGVGFVNAGGATQSINFRNAGGSLIQQIQYSDGDGSLFIGGGASAYALKFRYGNTVGITLNGSGNVLFGSSAAAMDAVVMRNASSAQLGLYRDVDVTGGAGAAATVISLGALNGSTQTPGAQIVGVLNNPASTGYLAFNTREAGVMAQRMQLTDKLFVDSGATDEVFRVNATSNPLVTMYRAGVRQLYFQATGSTSYLVAEGASNSLALYANGNLGVWVSPSGDVGIGGTPSYKLHVNGRISYSGAIGEGADATLDSVSTTVRVASSATWQALQLFTNGSARLNIDSSGQHGLGLTPVSSGSNRGLLQLLGSANGGIYLGNTANAASNVLDWYEEGTWTPGLTFGGASTGWAFFGGGDFTRIGNRVFFTGVIQVSTVGSATGSCVLNGFPYAATSTGYVRNVATWASSLTGIGVGLVGSMSLATCSLYSIASGTGNLTAITHANCPVGANFQVVGHFFI
jgi:hypothetical protein